MPAHLGSAARAARTESRTSFRDARATFCPSASYVRPDSERGKAPPMNSLYVFLTGRRLAIAVLELQIRPQTVPPALAAEARLLVAAERRRRVEPVVRVRPDYAGAQAFGHPENARALLGPHACAETVRRVVRLLDRFIRRAERQDREHRPEDLLLRDPVALRDVREDRRHEPVALLGQTTRRLVDLRTLVLAHSDELLDLVELLLRVDRADVGVLVERIADSQRREPALQLLDDGLVDRLLHEETRARAAHVPLVEVDAVDDSLDGLIERRVVEDDVRGLASELERQLLAGAGKLALERPADLCRPGEGDLVDIVGLDDRGAGSTVARDDVDDAGRQLRLTQDVAEQERAERRRLGRLQDDGVPCGERRRDLPREHQQREVPGNDLARDADRPRPPVRERVLELVRPACVVEEVRGREREVDVARLPDRLAAVQRFEHRELARPLLEGAPDPEQVLRALGGRDLRPAVVERPPRGVDCSGYVLAPRLRDLGE